MEVVYLTDHWTLKQAEQHMGNFIEEVCYK